MIGYLRGRLVVQTEETVILDVNGVGYEVYCSASALSKMSQGETAEIFTHMIAKEDGVSLFGFSSLKERDLFLRLTSVSGVGPKTGIAVFSSMSVEDFSVAIATADVKRISAVKGLGKKTAEKVILELHGKISAEELLGQNGGIDRPVLTQKLSKEDEDIVNALMGFGYKRQESVQALKKAKESGATTVEEILRKALQMGF